MPGFDLKTALQLTTGTIDRRAALFRNLVIGVVALILIPIPWALIQWSWMPLAGWLGITPLCVAFLCLDIKKIDQWQGKIMAAWRQGELDLDLFSQTMVTLRSLPPGTLKAMLATLPTHAISESVQPLNDDIKSMISRALRTINQCRFYRTAAMGMVVSLGSIALVAALLLWSWYPFLGFPGALVCIPIYKWLQWFRLSRLGKKISELGNGPDRKVLAEIINKMNWDAICEKYKDRWLAPHMSG